MTGLVFPAPYFGAKRYVARIVWDAIGRDVHHYVEPFCGSAAVLLAEPAHQQRTETINDANGYVVNVLRALRADPEAVAAWADWPVAECDLMARHLWLVNEGKPDVARLMADPDYYDAKAAGWWLWGASCWIGAGWCNGRGPWTTARLLGESSDTPTAGVRRKLPHLGNRGQGVHRQLPHLTRAQGVHRGHSAHDRRAFLRDWFRALARRLERVRITCGDWQRVITPAVLFSPSREPHVRVGVFLDPPYRRDNGRDVDLYTMESDCAQDVAAWAFAHGDDPRLRIVLAGWEGDVTLPPGWREVRWSRPGGSGYANQSGKRSQERERLWLSPHCLGESKTLPLLAAIETREA